MIRVSLPHNAALLSHAAGLMQTRLLPTLLLLGVAGLSACDPAPTLTQTTIPGAQFLTLRCIDNDGQGAPLDGCGCVDRVEGADGMVQFRQMGRVECDCRTLDIEANVLSAVGRVQATCAGAECVPDRDPITGDFIAVESSSPASSSIACAPARSGEVHGYVGTVGRGEIAVLDLITDPGDADAKSIIDVDRTIPGITAVYIGDLISDVETHPNGDFVFAVNSSSGSLTIVRTDDDVLPLSTIELGEGPLLDAAVWPPIGRPQPRGAAPIAFVSAPRTGKVLQIDLDALAEAEGAAPDVITATFSLPDDAAPGRIAVHPDGTALLVGHARTAQITVFDLTGAAAPRTIDLAPRQLCADGYLVRLVEPDEDVTCTDGLDNDGDGQIDAADDSCTGAARTEANDPRCAKLSECVDGIDNDDDGLIDDADPDCAGDCAGDDCPALAAQLDWERPEVPACADGLDNDGDGLTDRLDPGCEDEGDINEADAIELKGTPACSNGEDDDADGLIDDLDPGCTDDDAALRYRFERINECADRVDNDSDGLIDAEADPECWGAADTSESSDALHTGPTEILTMRVDLATVSRVFAYVIDGAGNLLWIDLDDAALPVSRFNLGRVSPLALAARQIGQISSLLVVGDDTTLRSIEISAPTPMRTADGLPIFGRLDPERSDINGGRLYFTAFYVVEEGVAYGVSGLEEHFSGPDDAGYLARNPVHIERAEPIVMGEAPEDRVPLSLVDASGRYTAFDRGRLDPLLYAAPTTRTFLHDEANVVQTAQARTNRVANIPRFQYGNSPAQFDPARHPTFCQLAQPSATGELVEPASACIPTGFTATGQFEARVETDARTEFRTDLFEGVRVIEDRVESVLPGTFTVAYQGELPSSDSRTGQFAGRAGDDAWTMVDYNEDFCRTGVEEGDVLLVDVFVPAPLAAGETLPSECRALKPENRPGDPLLLREPLRYRIAQVSAHQLELVRDDSTAADQLSRDERAEPLGYFEPPPAPLEACAAQFIAYHVRAGKGDWVLTGPGGYRHPWLNAGGQCVQSASRLNAGRVGRAQLDEPFENEWFRFTIGAFRDATTDNGVPTNSQPHLLDARFVFDVATGVLTRRLVDFVVTPGGMQWLPNDDRVYAVDTAFETLVEAAGLNVYRQVMAQIRRFR